MHGRPAFPGLSGMCPVTLFHLIPYGEEYLSNNGIEITSGSVLNDLKACIEGQRIPVTPLFTYSIKHIGNCHNAGRKRYLLTGESIRISPAVPLLMV